MTEHHDAAHPCTHVAGDALSPADPTPGMSRQVALHTESMWSGTVDTEAGTASGWHHHGEHDTTLYVVSGRMRLESGPGGAVVVEAGPGDFLRVPAGAVHRESNPGESTSRAVIVRCGSGTPTVNVDGPAPEAPTGTSLTPTSASPTSASPTSPSPTSPSPTSPAPTSPAPTSSAPTST